MFGIGPMELIVIAVVAIVFIGPQRLPEAMKKFGKLFVQVRRQTQDIRSGFNDVVRDAERELELEKIKGLKDQLEKVKPVNMVEHAVKSAINDDTPAKDDTQYHESHYVDGKYEPGDGYIDPDTFLEEAKKRDAELLKPKPQPTEPVVPATEPPASDVSGTDAPPPADSGNANHGDPEKSKP
ncbi:MAG: twin-arginine translocase TatA/TatE family subunit [Pseudobacteriovorax sp.]|nr:twin-arginine translocase TatA/TatE family subunit [Pseudobacteriovorax sp.]